MAKIAELNEASCRLLENEILVAAQDIAQKHGLDFQMLPGNSWPDGSTFVARCQFSLPPREESVATRKEEQDYLTYAESFGVRPAWLKQEFQRGSFTYKVVGLRVNEPKECIVLQRSDGSRCHEDGKLVRKYLGEGG